MALNNDTKPARIPNPSMFAEYGRSGIKRFAGRMHEEFLTNLRGRHGTRVYREMSENDEIVGASLYAIERVIASASWNVEPADIGNEYDKDAEFLEECRIDMEHSWSDFVLEAISHLTYGWSLLEQVYKIRKGESKNPKLNSRYGDGRIGWRKFGRRMQSTLDSWDFDDETGSVKGMIQLPPPDYKPLYIPIDKSLHFRTKIEGNNPEGRSILRNAYKSYYFKKNVQMLEAIGLERDLVGVPVLQPPENWDITAPKNSGLLSYAENLLGNLRRDEQEGVFLPPGWELKLLTIGNSRRQFDTDRIISRYDKRIAITMLAQFIMLGMDRVGSFALSSDQNDLFKVATQSHLNRVAQTINTVAVPRLFSLNPTLGKSGKLPRLIPSSVAMPNLKDVAAYINALAKAQVLPTEDDDLNVALVKVGRFFEANEAKIGDLYRRSRDTRLKGGIKPMKNVVDADATTDNDSGNIDSKRNMKIVKSDLNSDKE